MRLGIISDSHDNLHNLERAIDMMLELKVDGVAHAGDFVAPFSVKRLQRLNVPIWAVKGNNDGERAGLRNAFSYMRAFYCENDLDFEIEGRRLHMQHIPHNWSDVLRSSTPPDVLIFGHTHQRFLRTAGQEIVSPNSMHTDLPTSCPTLIVNPGELCGWSTGQGSFALLDTKKMRVEFHTL